MKLSASIILTLATTLCLVGGCDFNNKFATDDRLERGLVIILPGIEGESLYNHHIRQGLYDAGVPYGLIIHNWGFPIPGISLLVNQTDTAGNRRAADKLADKIAAYQSNYPNRPVYLIGHSGGGGVSVFTLEAMAYHGAGAISGAVLISSSISADYDLSMAISRTKQGIANYYNPQDSALLGLGTSIMGNVDGGHGPSAGRTGFERGYRGLYQIDITSDKTDWLGDAHTVATNVRFVTEYIAPWIGSQRWPPLHARD